MTPKERAAMQQALECAERCESIDGLYSWADTITDLREALEQPVSQELCVECGRPTISAESKCNDCHSMDDNAPQPASQEPTADVFKFLLGEGELEGCSFGERNEAKRGNFWWRKHLREALTEQAEPAAYTNKEQLAYLKDPRYQAAPMAMWSKPFDKRVNVSLYAAPVRTKDLTDDEIAECFIAGDEVASGRAVIKKFKELNCG